MRLSGLPTSNQTLVYTWKAILNLTQGKLLSLKDGIRFMLNETLYDKCSMKAKLVKEKVVRIKDEITISSPGRSLHLYHQVHTRFGAL